jgi:hypothetical protein
MLDELEEMRDLHLGLPKASAIPLLPWTDLVVGTRDENGRKNHISTFVSIFFGGNGSGFGKYGFKNGIGICGHTETDKYGWRAGKLN